MKRIALDKAAEHLELAKAAISDMATATTFKAYEQAWNQFLAQVSRFYGKIEQGAKGCKQSEPWFGRRKRERKVDDLLSYLHHARDCEEHSIDPTTALTADHLRAQVSEGSGFKIAFEYMLDSAGKQHFRNIRAKNDDGEDLPYELVNPKISLLPVIDRRFGDKFDPPSMHQTRPIVDTTPRGVASLAVNYLEMMLAEAWNLPLRY